MVPESSVTTRVIACAGFGATLLDTRRVRSPGPGEMLLRIRVSGLCGTDLFKLAHDTAAPGTVLGHEIVGAVEALGEGTRGFAVGDRVVVPHHVPCGECALCSRGSETMCPVFRENLLEPGGFSERVLVKERAVRLAARKVPDGISDEAAVFLEPAACVLRGVERAGLPRRDATTPTAKAPCAVVLGAGSMGLLHLLVVRAVRPDAKVVVTDRFAERLHLAKRLGASAALLPGDDLVAAVRTMTDGLGADAVFDTVGGTKILELALVLTRHGGTVVLFAHAIEGECAAFDLNNLFKHERRVVGTYSGALREQEEVWRLIAAGLLDASPIVTHRMPYSSFDEGVRRSTDREALKVLFVPEKSYG